jgi:hypothetical protein
VRPAAGLAAAAALLAALALTVALVPVGGAAGGRRPAAASAKAPGCARHVGPAAGRIRRAAAAARPGQVVCVTAGAIGDLDLSGIVHGRDVTVRGASGRRTSATGVEVDSSSHLVIEGFHLTGPVTANRQTETDHITVRGNDIGPSVAGVTTVPSWSDAGAHHWVVERNFFHDIRCTAACPGIGGGYAIAAAGNSPAWIVRYNRFERIREDMIQSGLPKRWVVDHNWFGPGDFDRPPGYSGHPDMWQTMESASHVRFTNNVVRDAHQSLGFILGDNDCETERTRATCQGYRDFRVVNNLFIRPVYGVGETCQFSPTDGFLFERNTLVDAGGCRWGAAPGVPWPSAAHLVIRRNILVGRSRLTCNDTAFTDSCGAFEAGARGQVRRVRSWTNRTYFRPRGVSRGVGARLSGREFRGFPFR